MKKFSEKTTGLIVFSDLKKLKYKLLYAFIILILLVVVAICILPIIWAALSGFKSVEEMHSVMPTFLPTRIDLSMLGEAWKRSGLSVNFMNSALIIAGCLVCDILFNGLAGYVLAKVRPAGTGVLNTLIFWTLLLPGISMVPLYMIICDLPFVHINLTGSFVPIWLMAGANVFNILLFRSHFNGIPDSYLEAAKLDGASDFKIFTKIIIPQSLPVIMVVAIFCVQSKWGDFMWPYLILNNTKFEPVSVKLYQLAQDIDGLPDNLYMLTIMISILPVIVLFSIFAKRIMGGMNMGGIKG